MYNEYVHKIRTIVGTVLIYIALYSTWINLHVHMYHLYVCECYRSVKALQRQPKMYKDA